MDTTHKTIAIRLVIYTFRFLQLALQCRFGYCKLKYLEGTDATVTEAVVHEGVAEYPHSTINGIPTYSSHSSTALYETQESGQEESGPNFSGIF